MAELQNSRVAELLFTELPLCDFARTISEIAALLTRICGDQCKISWDYDDVASFDMPGTRILLSYSDSPYQKFTARLVLSVGPSGVSPLAGQSVMVHTALCAKMVARLHHRPMKGAKKPASLPAHGGYDDHSSSVGMDEIPF